MLAWSPRLRLGSYVEWYQNSLAIPGSPVAEHHRETYGDRPYESVVEEFAASIERWDPEAWADLFAVGGARYVVLVTKHHDGFLLWPSATPNPHRGDWQSGRDVVGELAAAVRARGLRFGVYYSGGLDWTFGGLPIDDLPAMFAAIPQGEDYLRYADAHWRELVERYQPDVLWNDIGYPRSADLDELFGWYYGRIPEGVVNDRFDFLGSHTGESHCDFTTLEYATELPVGDRKWESTRGLGTSFGFNRAERSADHLTADDIVRLLAEVAGAGGNLLLNVGPASDGTVPWHQAERLLAVGWWLRANGPAVFGTSPAGDHGVTTTEGLPVVCTRSGEALFVIVEGTPAGPTVGLRGLSPEPAATIELLGHGGPLAWTAVAGGVSVELPALLPEAPAVTFRVQPESG